MCFLSTKKGTIKRKIAECPNLDYGEIVATKKQRSPHNNAIGAEFNSFFGG